MPLIVSWPGVVRPGTRTDAMISCVDLLPMLIEAGGGKPPAGIDGRSCMPVLRGQTATHRDVAYITHSGDGDMNVYPMRGVRTARWKYILNLHPEFAFTTHIDRNADKEPDPYWPSWEAAATTDVRAASLMHRYRERPAEELYDLDADPDELTNVASLPGNADIKSRLRRDLEGWMNAEGDQRKVFNKPHLLTDFAPVETPQIAGKALTITCSVTTRARDGVILAQGGNRFGYALHIKDGKLLFSVRENRQLIVVTGPEAPARKFALEAHLERDGAMTLAVDGAVVARGKAAGVITAQPAEELSVGQDTGFAVGDYVAPNPLTGVVEGVTVVAR